MMHECPFCGEVCDCDMDDTWGLPIPNDCPHVCGDDEDDNFDDELAEQVTVENSIAEKGD